MTLGAGSGSREGELATPAGVGVLLHPNVKLGGRLRPSPTPIRKRRLCAAQLSAMALFERFSSLALQFHPCVEWSGGWACLKDAAKAKGGPSCEMTYCFPYQGIPHSPKPAEQRAPGVEAPGFFGDGSEFSSSLPARFGAVCLLLLAAGSLALQCEP